VFSVISVVGFSFRHLGFEIGAICVICGSRFSMNLSFRPIRPEDDAAVASIIRAVMPEFGAGGPRFAIHDAEVDAMAEAYAAPGAAYFVVEDERGRVIGGGGVARLDGADAGTCELRKMYFLPKARGTGMGERLLRHLLSVARQLGYTTLYLETLTGMDAAMKLYAKVGFRPLCAPMGATGHTGCDRWYAMKLNHHPLDEG
jgi:putative acetyltransferase